MSKSCWLIGAGNMAAEYIKVLKTIGVDFAVIGRSEEKVKTLKEKFDITAVAGGIDAYLKKDSEIPECAIVAVTLKELTSVTLQLLNLGIKNILVEKPAGLNQDDIDNLVKTAEGLNANLYVAYNRRFYTSVKLLKEKIEEDGGIISVNFEFTEWPHVIETFNYPPDISGKFVIANSTHVIDTVFHLTGRPRTLHSQVTGHDYVSWHPSGSVFMGMGITEKDIPFSYSTNWAAPGRWVIEILTRNNRYYFKPMERLAIQKKASVQVNEYEGDYSDDINFKPGLLHMVKAFMKNDEGVLCTIKEHQQNFPFYEKIAGYKA